MDNISRCHADAAVSAGIVASVHDANAVRMGRQFRTVMEAYEKSIGAENALKLAPTIANLVRNRYFG